MTTSASNVTSGFIDLATFDELEKYMYGGGDATAYFVRDTCKATWFTQVPVVLSRASGQPGFDTEWSVSISRAGDYLLSTWLRLTTPQLTLTPGQINPAAFRVRWTRNLMHNLIRECSITFNDLVAARFDNYHLDFWSAFTVPAGKRSGYNNMIGNFDSLTSPQQSGVAVPGTGSVGENIGKLPPVTLNLPLPFFFSRDTGVALPTAALPYNDMRINFSFRDWTQLLEVYDTSDLQKSRPAKASDFSAIPVLSNVQVWANYAIVSNDERKRMACAPRDILIEQVQTAPRQTFYGGTDRSPRYDIRFSHAIKVLFFSARNTSNASGWSNYTAGSPSLFSSGTTPATTLDSINFNTESMVDPISLTSLIYENTTRLSQMGSDYYSLVNPWYHAPSIPLDTGYHMYSYSLDFYSLDPMGSTNYGKLTNVSIVPEVSGDAVVTQPGGKWPLTVLQTGVTSTNTLPGDFLFPQQWEFITTAVSNNVVRISGGALGFPVL
jgi:hypothetical protein